MIKTYSQKQGFLICPFTIPGEKSDIAKLAMLQIHSIAVILVLASNHLSEVSTIVNLFLNFCHYFNLVANIKSTTNNI